MWRTIDIGAEVRRCGRHVRRCRLREPDQRGAQRRHRGLRLLQRDAQVVQQHVERRLAIELQHQVAVGTR